MILRAKVVELFQKAVKIAEGDKKKMYYNGDNNDYPLSIRLVIANSPTASRAQRLAKRFCAGESISKRNKQGVISPPVHFNDQEIVNKRTGLRVHQFAEEIADNYTEQGGVFIHVAYELDDDGNLQMGDKTVLDFVNCRIQRVDSDGYQGKIYYGDFTSNEKGKQFKNKNNIKEYLPFNPNLEEVKKQILSGKDDGDLVEAIKEFKGTVLYVNTTPKYIYPIPCVDAVFNNCDTEYRMSVYYNEQTRLGFMGKVIAVVNGGMDEKMRETLEENITKCLGVEGSSDLLLIQLEGVIDNLEEVIKIISVENNMDHDMLDKLKVYLRDSILGAFYDLPAQLILTSDGALFSPSADALEASKKFYSDSTKGIRDLVESTINTLGYNYIINEIK